MSMNGATKHLSSFEEGVVSASTVTTTSTTANGADYTNNDNKSSLDHIYSFLTNPQRRTCLRQCVSSRRFLLALVAFLFVFAVVTSILLIIVYVGSSDREVEDAAFLNQHVDWRDKCTRKCGGKFATPPLLLISLDGFRADYLDRELTPAIARILNCGTTTDYMIPSYPSKTFPNHYTIVTGLYPEAHGIVDNVFMDQTHPEIWNTVAKNGKKSGVFFWPGSEVPIGGNLPTYQVQYDSATPFSKRVDQVIAWLELPANDRPDFLAMYFDQPDSACHAGGPDSDVVNSALITVDAMLNYLVHRLDKKEYLGCINLVVLSDHGGQKIREDHAMSVEAYMNVSDPNVKVFGGAIGQIKFLNKTQVNMTQALNKFACQEGHNFRAYTRDIMPIRYHYSNNDRIGDIVIDAVAGTRVFPTNKALAGPAYEKGDHGYDNRLMQMRAFFGAYGPSIKQNHRIPPFENIELYNLFADLMELPYSAANNGTRGLLYPILKNPKDHRNTPTIRLEECQGVEMLKCGDGCNNFELSHFNGKDANDDGGAGQQCISRFEGQVEVPLWVQKQEDLCVIHLCNSTMVYSRRRPHLGYYVESVLNGVVANIDHRANCSAHLLFQSPTSEEGVNTTPTEQPTTTTPSTSTNPHKDPFDTTEATKAMAMTIEMGGTATPDESPSPTAPTPPTVEAPMSECRRLSGAGKGAAKNVSWISLFSNNDYSRYISQGQIPAPAGFVEGVWKQLLKLIRQYQRHYKHLMMWSGPIFDNNYDGLIDGGGAARAAEVDSDESNDTVAAARANEQQHPQQKPTHVFVILMRCRDGKWHSEEKRCQDTQQTSTLSFVLPIVEKDINCLFPVEYIFRHTTRIRDIELLTNNEWFVNRDAYPPELALHLRTYINDQLWQLENSEQKS